MLKIFEENPQYLGNGKSYRESNDGFGILRPENLLIDAKHFEIESKIFGSKFEKNAQNLGNAEVCLKSKAGFGFPAPKYIS